MSRAGAGSNQGLKITPVVATEPDPLGAAGDAVTRAHAQKNCAAVILAISHLAVPDLPPQQRERFERLRGAATRLVHLLNEEMREAITEDVEVAHVVDAAHDLVRDRAQAGGARSPSAAPVAACAGTPAL